MFQFRFTTEQRLPNLFQVVRRRAGGGVAAPANSPAPVPPGTLIVPPQITVLRRSSGSGQRQSYTVTMVKGGVVDAADGTGAPLYAVPANVGPRTMDYDALFNQAIYDAGTAACKVSPAPPTIAFWIDLGGAFDTLNLRRRSRRDPDARRRTRRT